MTITAGEQNITVTLPTKNFLRVTLVKLKPIALEYLQQGHSGTISDFFSWLEKELDMKGKIVLM